MEVVELQVVLARPHDLHGLADLPGEQRRFGGVVRLGLAAEAAAEERDVTGHVGRRDAQRRADGVLHRLRVLRAGPDLRLAAAHLGDRHRRLHRRVRQHRRVVRRLVRRAGADRRVDVALLAHDPAGRLDDVHQRRAERGRVERRIRTRRPGRRQRLAALHRRPRARADHRDAAERLEQVGRLRFRQLDDIGHARRPCAPPHRRPTPANSRAPAVAKSRRTPCRDDRRRRRRCPAP